MILRHNSHRLVLFRKLRSSAPSMLNAAPLLKSPFPVDCLKMSAITVDILTSLQDKTDEEVTVQLSALNALLSQRFAFPDVDESTKSEISRQLISRLSKITPTCLRSFLELLRILSRDRHGINALISEQTTDLISAASVCRSVEIPDLSPRSVDLPVVLEGQKCLSNALFHSSVIRDRFIVSGAFDDVANRINQRAAAQTIPSTEELALFDLLPADTQTAVQDAVHLRQFDLRLCFIVSAHVVEAQERLRDILGVVDSLIVLLDQHISHTTALAHNTDDDLSCEILKLLFNVFCHAKKDTLKNESVPKFERLAQLCARVIKAQSNVGGVEDVAQNAVNLLATLPTIVTVLCPLVVNTDGASAPSYDGYDMSFVDAVLTLFERKMETVSKAETELLSTYLSVLIYLSRSSKAARRYIRLKVVPPLRAKDVERRPEEGDSLRSRLVRLMMSASQARELAAEFLFVLCKRSVPRLIKYSGFGNAAGLLANNGLLGGLGGVPSASDSEDSETDDYEQVKDQVNPVLGCIDEPKPNPFDGMSDEQKEYEAMKLVDAMNKLMDDGIIKPGTVGDDGRVRPVRHVLEMCKDQEDTEKNDSDDD